MFEFYNITTDGGQVEYIWQCQNCGSLTKGDDAPDQCEYCNEHPEEDE